MSKDTNISKQKKIVELREIVEDCLRNNLINQANYNGLILSIDEIDDLDYDTFIDFLEETKDNHLLDVAILKKYGNDIGNRILNKEYWIGMKTFELLDSLGKPDEIRRNDTIEKKIVKYYYGHGKYKGYSKEFIIENYIVIEINH